MKTGKITRIFLLGSLLATCSAQCPKLEAADGANVLDQVGRFLGVGYSKRGYHSGHRAILSLPHRYQAPSSYPSYQLQQLYYRQYTQPSVNHFYSQSMGGSYQPFSSGNLTFGSQSAAPRMVPGNSEGPLPPQATDRQVEEIEAEPSKPQEPPPQWLKPYLEEQGASSKLKEQAKEIFEEDLSPSDLLDDESLDLESGPSEPTESDDDLLLYDARRRIIKPTVNRYARPIR